MKKLRVGIVGLEPRGRSMTRLAAEFDNVTIAAGCDIRTHNWFEKQWHCPMALADMFLDAQFYEDYDEMLEKANLDIVIVETGADIHAAFCVKEGLAMTLPGIYAEESSKRGGEVMRMKYPWDPDWTATFD